MIHWETVKEFFGFGRKIETPPTDFLRRGERRGSKVETSPDAGAGVKPIVQYMSLKELERRKRTTKPKQFYRRGGQYFFVCDDSLIEDIMLIYVLSEMFSDGDIQQYEDMPTEEANAVTEDLVDMDVSDTAVEALAPTSSDAYSYPTPPGPAYEPYVAPEPEPETKYSSSSSAGSSYGSGSSDYDSGSSDSGGGSDD